MPEVHRGIDAHDIVANAPAEVEDHVFEAVLCGEVNVLLVRLRVDPRLEVDAGYVPVVPPLPCDLAGLHPREVPGRGLGKRHHYVGRDELGRLGGEHEHAPRESARSIRLGDVTGPREDALAYAARVAAFSADALELRRIAGEDSFERPAVSASDKTPARIVPEIGLGDAHRRAVRKESHRSVPDCLGGVRRSLGERQLMIHALPRVLKPVVRIVARPVRAGDNLLVARREPERQPLVLHDHLPAARGHVAECDAVVTRRGLDRPAVSERKRHEARDARDFGFLVDRRRYLLLPLRANSVEELRTLAQRRPALKFERDLGRLGHRLSVAEYLVGKRLADGEDD